MNRELDTKNHLTHFSQKTRKIELNQIINLGIDDDLVENIYLLFPDKYNDFCYHPNYPLNCLKSVTVEVISKINQSFKIIYYPPFKCTLSNETYNICEYMTIGDVIFIPRTFKYDQDKSVFVGSFFPKQKIIICPLRIQSKTHQIKVSIQRWEETLLSLNINNLNTNIKNLINLYASDSIYLKPIPITYIRSALFYSNAIIPDHIPKSESLDDIPLHFIQEERKFWSDYNQCTIKDNENQNILNYFSRCSYDTYSSHLFFVHKMDLDNIKDITMKIGDNIICRFSGIWLQTRYEEYKQTIDQNMNFFEDSYILLPIPQIYNISIFWHSLNFIIKIKTPSTNPPIIYFKSIKDQNNKYVPDGRCKSAIIQVNSNCISYFNETSSKLKLECNGLASAYSALAS